MILNATSQAVTTFNQLAQRDALQAGLSASTSSTSSSSSSSDSTSSSKTSSKQSSASTELTPEQKRQLASLQRIDALVRQHEQMHIAAGGSVVTSGPNYNYTYGPDGKQYAISGEVGIDTSPEKKPQENIDKGRLIQRAALAPPDPSSADLRAAAVGSQLEAQGQTDLIAEQAAAKAVEKQQAPTSEPGATSESQQVNATAQNAEAAVQETQAFSNDVLARAYSAGQDASNTSSFSLFA